MPRTRSWLIIEQGFVVYKTLSLLGGSITVSSYGLAVGLRPKLDSKTFSSDLDRN